jgi:hypothetical protein
MRFLKKYPNDFGLHDGRKRCRTYRMFTDLSLINEANDDLNYLGGNQYTKNKIGADLKSRDCY